MTPTRAPAARRTHRPVVALVLAWIAGTVLVLTPALAPGAAPPAHADDPESWVKIRIDSLTPSIPAAGDTVVISGTVTNTSTTPLHKVQALMWRNQAPISESEQLAAALDSDADQPIGSRIGAFGTFQQLTVSNDPTTADLPADLPPGESLPFTVRAELSQFEFPPTAGFYLVGVHVRGTLDGLGGADVTLGRSRTLLPVGLAGAAVDRPTQVASVVVLTTTPTRIDQPGGGAVFIDDSLATKITEDGDLGRMLALAEQPGYSVLVDPALVEAVRAMTSAYQVRGADGTTQRHAADPGARAWLDRLDRIPDDRLFRLPYANPDLAALAHGAAGLYDPELGADVLPDAPLVTLPAGGFADAETLRLAATGDPSAILLSRTSVGTGAPLRTDPAGDAPVVVFDEGILNGGPGPAPRDTPTQIRQRFLAETYLLASGSAPGVVVQLITTPNQSRAVPSVDAPWVAATALSGILDGRPASWDGSLTYPEKARASELPEAAVSAAERLAHSYTAYTELTADAASPGAGSEAAARATSTAWRGDDAGREALLRPQQAQLDRLLDGSALRLDRLNNVVLTDESGRAGVTVINDTDVAVRVDVLFQSANAQRLTVTTIEDEPIPPHSRAALTIEITAQANGEVPVTAQLATAEGTPIGRPAEFVVSATQYGRLGGLIAITAAVVLLVSTFLRIRQVRRESAARDAAAVEVGRIDGMVDGMIDTRGPSAPVPRRPPDDPSADRSDSAEGQQHPTRSDG